MAKIIQLSEKIKNLIAAGEVVERPMSVVKELIENSIDAGATMIKIDLIDAGIKKICVIDNGYGIVKDDIPVAMQRHATSKIHDENDLFAISSLGFRGEALPSIASVADFTIASKTADDDHGWVYHYVAGNLVDTQPIAMETGTQIEVSNLFYNTPARFQHLGNSYRELSLTLDFFTKLALAAPHIALTIANDGKTLLKTLGDGNLSEVIRCAYGNSVQKALITFKGKNDLYTISGYTTSNTIMRSNRNAITIIVNGRVIKNQTILYGITEAYKSILPSLKYPITVLNIQCDCRLVDVNVHPAKMELRFTDEYLLRDLITSTIKSSLSDRELLKFDNYQPNAEKSVLTTIETMHAEPVHKEEKLQNDDTEIWDLFKTEPSIISETSSAYDAPNVSEVPLSETIEQPALFCKSDRSFFQSLRYIGQALSTYLIFDGDDTLYLIDQHAAMERIMYEKISNELNQPSNATYTLLVPLTIELSIAEMASISEMLPKLSLMQIKCEEFGDSTLLVREVPSWFIAGSEEIFIRDIIHHLQSGSKTGKVKLYDNMAKSLSCKQSIKANMSISLSEVEALLKGLDACEMPYTCPHGRPTLIKFSNYEIEKLFKRVI